jgi:hypothetical protein
MTRWPPSLQARKKKEKDLMAIRWSRNDLMAAKSPNEKEK